MTRQQHLPVAVRRTVTLLLTLVLVLLPLLSRLEPAGTAMLGLPGILCAQAGDSPSAPSPATHEDCALACALVQVQILAAAQPGLPKRREPIPAARPDVLHFSASPGVAHAELRIRGPPVVPVA